MIYIISAVYRSKIIRHSVFA